MRHLHIDIETFCELDVSDVGVYRYAEDASFKIILFAYAWDNGPVCIIDLSAGEEIPDDVWSALADADVLKIAHNAAFEIECLRSFLMLDLEARQWFCTMVGSAYMGLPLSLDKIGHVLGLSEQKDSKGKALITYFCKPCKPTKRNGGRTVNLPEHDPEKWEAFKEYCRQDVRTEREINNYLSRFPGLPRTELEYWILDQVINGTGIQIDREFIDAAIETRERFISDVHAQIVQMTGIDNPNSLPQLKAWIEKELGHKIPGLYKDYVNDAIEGGFLPPHVAHVFRLRQLASNTSVSKYDTMLSYAQKDGRIRAQIQFYGANRTGRFAGRGVQPQNLKRTIKGRANLETARLSVINGYADLLYGDPLAVISKLTRTALVAPAGNSLVVSDFAAIEARVIAWLAGEDWVLDVFNTHGKIYEATAAGMFNVPLEMVTSGSDLRAKGKVATLALGYQGGVGALVAMGALREGLDEAELPALVSAWRSANPHIVKLWRAVEMAAKQVVTKKTSHTIRGKYCSLRFSYDRGYMFIELPSRRRLAYYGAVVDKGRLSYWGVNQTRKTWEKIDTYGGSLVENITQAVARDCLCDAMLRIHRDIGLPIPMHIHDEIVVEAPDRRATEVLQQMNDIMCVSPQWAKDLPLKGSGYISKYYKKD